MGAETEDDFESNVYQDELEECEGTKQELRLKIKELQKELAAERDMVKQLQSANLMLQKSKFTFNSIAVSSSHNYTLV